MIILIYLFLFPKVAKVERSDDLTVYNPLRDHIFIIINYLLIYLFLFPKVPKVERSDDLTVYNPLRDHIFFIINYLFLENRNYLYLVYYYSI